MFSFAWNSRSQHSIHFLASRNEENKGYYILCIFINSSISLFLSIPLPPYFYQFLLFLIFINSSSSLFLSIPPLPYFYQFLLFLIFINSFSSQNLSIHSPYFYRFFFLIFMNSSPSSNISIYCPYFYRFLFFPHHSYPRISSSFFSFSLIISFPPQIYQFLFHIIITFWFDLWFGLFYQLSSFPLINILFSFSLSFLPTFFIFIFCY